MIYSFENARSLIAIALIILITQLVTGRAHGTGDDATILTRIAPFGVVKIAAPSGPKGNLTGEQVYGQVCKTCHEGGLAGAHKIGDKAAWAKVVAQGAEISDSREPLLEAQLQIAQE